LSGLDHDTRSLASDGRRNVVLTGFMGTGKTTVGRLLAEELGFEFVDTDVLIEQRHGPIADIFATGGEEAFREIERGVASELATRTGLVVSTGGRMMLDPANVRALSANGRVFCLVATPEEVFERVTGDPSRVERPLLQVPDPRQRIVELMSERDPDYRRFPQLVTDARAPEAVARDLQAVTSSDPHTYAIENPGGNYDFAVGAGLLPFVRQLAAIDGPMVVISDDEVADLYLPSVGDVDLEIRLPAGHGRKSLRSVEHVYDALLDADIDRSATIVSLGTSVVEDVAGFAAATYLRGLDLVHCPTNLIAMIDTSIGGKVGLDRPHGRNLVGLFKQPKAVVADVATLQTLEPREFAAGMAEVVKHGLIAGSDLLTQVEAGEWTAADNALPGALGRLQSLVAQAIQVKIAIVQEDPLEAGRRAVLNLGHTFAYGIEHLTGGDVNHGEAVGIGLVAAARLSERRGIAKPGLADHVESLLTHVGLGTRLPDHIPPGQLVEAMRRDKKRLGGRLRFVLLRDVGDVIVTDDVSGDDLLAVVDSLNP
jgi:shikimate kinase / 3-dehydroquinate synthase